MVKFASEISKLGEQKLQISKKCVAHSAQFEDEFRARVRVQDTTKSKIRCILEMDPN